MEINIKTSSENVCFLISDIVGDLLLIAVILLIFNILIFEYYQQIITITNNLISKNYEQQP